MSSKSFKIDSSIITTSFGCVDPMKYFKLNLPKDDYFIKFRDFLGLIGTFEGTDVQIIHNYFNHSISNFRETQKIEITKEYDENIKPNIYLHKYTFDDYINLIISETDMMGNSYASIIYTNNRNENINIGSHYRVKLLNSFNNCQLFTLGGQLENILEKDLTDELTVKIISTLFKTAREIMNKPLAVIEISDLAYIRFQEIVKHDDVKKYIRIISDSPFRSTNDNNRVLVIVKIDK